MPTTPTPKTALLYQNRSKTTTLIDIPTSIALAQGTPERPHTATLLSSTLLQTPYPSSEPKTAAARARVLERMIDPEDRGADETLRVLIASALAEIREEYVGGEWCLPRTLSQIQPIRQRKKRKLGRADAAAAAAIGTTEPEIPVSNTDDTFTMGALQPLKLSLSPTSTISASTNITDRLIQNPHSTPTQLYLPPIPHPYTIPPHSSFHLTTITPCSTPLLSNAARTLHPTPTPTAGPGQFDFILLDPPWANRSVRRSRSYKTSEDMETDPLSALQGMLARHIPAQGLVGCWITNKAASRRQALEAFRAWDVSLVEEWVWVKTTVKGEPVTAVDGVWRKPFEILLLGRKEGRNEEGEEAEEVRRQDGVVQRVVVGVPDMHSRKPSLKELIAPVMEDRGTYRGLEIFARNLTAGYCAWGDEALKFNWGGHWSQPGVAVDGPASLRMSVNLG